MFLNLWWRNDLNAIDTIDAIKFIDIIEKLIENVIKQTIYFIVIKINKFNDIVDVDIDLNAIDKINETNDVIDKLI